MSEPAAHKLLKALQSLPLFDNPFLSMQAQNIAVVDHVLEQMEGDLYSEYIRTDTTPLEGSILVSALSEMWIFAVYELLRTWRQMARELVDYDKKLRAIRGRPDFDDQKTKILAPKKSAVRRAAVSEDFVKAFYGQQLERVEVDAAYATVLERALGQVTPAFKRLTALRISLAKHEVAGAPEMRAFAPGYARFDHLTGSLSWFIDLKDGTSDIISRRLVADSVREFLYPPDDEEDQEAGEREQRD